MSTWHWQVSRPSGPQSRMIIADGNARDQAGMAYQIASVLQYSPQDLITIDHYAPHDTAYRDQPIMIEIEVMQ